jgi:hypothetical protein
LRDWMLVIAWTVIVRCKATDRRGSNNAGAS